MRVAILGAGAIGLASAALLCERGHRPVLWAPSGRVPPAGKLLASGAVAGSFAPEVAADCASALAGAEAVLIAVPGYGHRAVIEAAAAHLLAGQTVLFSSHMSFSALYLRRLCPAPTIAAWGTTVVTGRRGDGMAVWVSNIRSRVDVAVLPAGEAAPALALCAELFGDRFVDRGALLAIALSNLNPQNHLAIALCNLTRMEKGEAWRQYANTTDAVGRLMEALDAERLALAAAAGVRVRTLHEHFRLSFAAVGATMGEMARSLAAGSGDPSGPTTLDSRYVLEDAPYGLWPTVCLARTLGVPAPLHEAGVALFSALYGRDFAAENDILPRLGDLRALLGRL
jgi:opine dehydrogenase